MLSGKVSWKFRIKRVVGGALLAGRREMFIRCHRKEYRLRAIKSDKPTCYSVSNPMTGHAGAGVSGTLVPVLLNDLKGEELCSKYS